MKMKEFRKIAKLHENEITRKTENGTGSLVTSPYHPPSATKKSFIRPHSLLVLKLYN